jgi:hypothetical protein
MSKKTLFDAVGQLAFALGYKNGDGTKLLPWNELPSWNDLLAEVRLLKSLDDNQSKDETDEQRYNRLNTPISFDDANLATKKIHEEISVLREKYHIPDMIYLCRVNTTEGPQHGSGSFGDPRNREYLYAMGLGASQRDRAKLIASYQSGK